MLLLARAPATAAVELALALPWEDLKGAKRHCEEDVRRTEERNLGKEESQAKLKG
jgi:hypothetical protein